MGDKSIEYTINADGSISLNFNGFQGKQCIKEAEKIRQGLADKGIEVVSESEVEYKPEYYVEEQQQEGEQQ